MPFKEGTMPGPQEAKVAANGQGDVWTGVNVQGKVYIAVRTRDGNDRARFWWIKALGNIEQLGLHGPEAEFDIPIAYAKLRVQTLNSDTIVYVSDSAKVNNSVTFKW
jgi:hypothetical protein